MVEMLTLNPETETLNPKTRPPGTCQRRRGVVRNPERRPPLRRPRARQSSNDPVFENYSFSSSEHTLCCKRRYKPTSPTRKRPPQEDHPRTLGMGLRESPRGVRFLMSEVPLYTARSDRWHFPPSLPLLARRLRLSSYIYFTCDRRRSQEHLAHKKQPPPRTLH